MLRAMDESGFVWKLVPPSYSPSPIRPDLRTKRRFGDSVLNRKALFLTLLRCILSPSWFTCKANGRLVMFGGQVAGLAIDALTFIPCVRFVACLANCILGLVALPLMLKERREMMRKA